MLKTYRRYLSTSCSIYSWLLFSTSSWGLPTSLVHAIAVGCSTLGGDLCLLDSLIMPPRLLFFYLPEAPDSENPSPNDAVELSFLIFFLKVLPRKPRAPPPVLAPYSVEANATESSVALWFSYGIFMVDFRYKLLDEECRKPFFFFEPESLPFWLLNRPVMSSSISAFSLAAGSWKACYTSCLISSVTCRSFSQGTWVSKYISWITIFVGFRLTGSSASSHSCWMA